jgi:hypothetical protein
LIQISRRPRAHIFLLVRTLVSCGDAASLVTPPPGLEAVRCRLQLRSASRVDFLDPDLNEQEQKIGQCLFVHFAPGN